MVFLSSFLNTIMYFIFLDNFMQIRHQSTRIASALQKSAKKKVKYKNSKKYGEVLEGQ